MATLSACCSPFSTSVLHYPEGPSTQYFKDSGSKYHTDNVFWDRGPFSSSWCRCAPAIQHGEELITGQRATADLFGEHFAKAERSIVADWGTESRSGPPDALPDADLQQIPSLYQLAGAFAGLKKGRAPGLTAIPGEAYAAAPIEAAFCHWPLLLRMATRRECPTLFKGGLAVAIPKPQKSPSLVSAWRNVLLQEPAAKAVGKSSRGRIVEVFSRSAMPVQCGAQKAVPLEFPMLHVRAHLASLQASGASGGILFIDAKDAYYSIIKHFLFTDGIMDTPAQLERAICSVHADESERRTLAAALVGPGLLAEADPSVQRYIKCL